MRIRLPSIQHDQPGFEALTNLSARTEDCYLQQIEVDLGLTSWFDADMCAPFGAILYRLGNKLNNIELTNIQPSVEKILAKNGFLSSYGRNKIPDRWGTTIPYQRFEVRDGRYFASYIEKELVHRAEMPRMSVGLLKKFRESVYEIFGNAVDHSQTELGIFSCGQFFPKKHCLNFSVADLGIGIRENVRQHAKLDLTADEAIAWATRDRNTTKTGRIPGGLGLKLLREFVDLNRGRIQIISDSGYWLSFRGGVRKQQLLNPFPGTVVTVEINTSDKQSYVLSSEVPETDIF